MNSLNSTPSEVTTITATHVFVVRGDERYPVHCHWFDPIEVIERRSVRERLQRIAELQQEWRQSPKSEKAA